MRLGWQVTRGLLAATDSASRSIANAASANAAVRRANKGSRAVRRGLVGPWDQIPAGSQDFLDYSGVATPNDVRWQTWAFPLGRYVLPKSRPLGDGFQVKDEFGLSPETANRHTVVYAPTQSGKTTSIIAPWIYAAMAQGYVVVALDLKGNGDLLTKVQDYAAAQGPLPTVAISSFDYTKPSSSVPWNWIRELAADDAAIEAAAGALVGRDRDNDPNREFRLRDLKWMRGLLEYASSSDHNWTVETLLRLLDDQPRLARYITNTAPDRARSRLSDLVYLPEGEYYTKVQFLTTYLEVLNTPALNRVTARRGLAMRDVAAEPGLVLVTAPLADGRLSEAVSGLFLSQLLNAQLKKFNIGARPVLLVLDEAPRLKERLDLPQLMATSASSGMSVLLALQEVTDFEERERDAILSNCVTHILLPGAGAPTTEYFGKRLGTRNVARQTQTMNYSRRDGASFQTGVQNADLPVLGRAEMTTPPGSGYSGIVHCHELTHKPILVDLTRHDLLPR